MRTLTVLRHAKAVPQEPGLDDFERPLAVRGREEAPIMGRFLRRAGLIPDVVICSPSARTRETAALVVAELGAATRVIYEPAIYEAEATELLEVVRRSPAQARHVLLIGHNPGLQRLALLMLETGLAPEHAELASNLPTSGVVAMELGVEAWTACRAACGRIVRFETPRRLRDGT